MILDGKPLLRGCRSSPVGWSGPVGLVPVGLVLVGLVPVGPVLVGPVPVGPVPVGPIPVGPVPVGPVPLSTSVRSVLMFQTSLYWKLLLE